ncbi:hypothetical protein CLU79DRAFT_764463 [Phycomyces nitens]|nr:hypothetical protein CLU79DRAFT_764463 [Phycomyces nitens]
MPFATQAIIITPDNCWLIGFISYKNLVIITCKGLLFYLCIPITRKGIHTHKSHMCVCIHVYIYI